MNQPTSNKFCSLPPILAFWLIHSLAPLPAQDTRDIGRRGEVLLETFERLPSGELKKAETKVRVFAAGKNLGEFQTPRKLLNFISGQWVFSWQYNGKPKTAKSHRQAGEPTRFRIVIND